MENPIRIWKCTEPYQNEPNGLSSQDDIYQLQLQIEFAVLIQVCRFPGAKHHP